ncbi:MAG: elongation factor P--(R)-beta-lysine ligase [Gammaproteobacteria bacterium]|nr:elongation factor P--(R)-beta-lysine ligase [Gammaproteobacteria bacterium]
MKSQDAWRPSACLHHLKRRAEILANIRQFFSERQVLEVETPLMCQFTVTDPHVTGIPALYQSMGSSITRTLFLQTSPEYAMKRLLAAGIGSIYQISKAFRQGEVGRLHNPEFTMLEWYRLDFDHHALMDEMDALLQQILKTPPAERVSYGDLFRHYLGINPHTADEAVLIASAAEKNIPVSGTLPNRDAWLDLLWTHYIEPLVGQIRPLFLYDFPVSQAALAKIRNESQPVASRFEVYFKGIELANGFHELQDGKEQAKRFVLDLALRKELGISERLIDDRLLAALEHGLPACAGVALGIDRLMMLALECDQIADVISFAFDKA